MPEKPDRNSPLLKEIRERYKYGCQAWQPIWDEGRTNLQYLDPTVGPWDDKDRESRGNRPMVSPDELTQYVNQAKNQMRQNPRGIKVDPDSEGTDEKTAEFNQSLIRGIEYNSSAQRNVYTPAFESQVERGYGFWRLTRVKIDGNSAKQEIKLKGVLNSDSVVFDPDYTEADWSDAGWCFVIGPIPWDTYKQRWPNAETKDFEEDDHALAPEWVQDKVIMVAEYWKRIRQSNGKFKVKQYITNGLEILEEKDEIGSYLPIIPDIGREKYLNEGGKTVRKIYGMINSARQAYKGYCFVCSQELEEYGQSPKAPFLGAKGQFESDRQAFLECTKDPKAFLQYDPVVDTATGALLPPPSRPQFTPNIAAYQAGEEGWKRKIQAGMGISPLPTAAQRQNEKSGVALEKIQTQESIGVFDFIDNHDRALQLTGRILVEWIPLVYNWQGSLGIVKADGTRRVVKINTDEPYEDDKGEMQHYRVVDDEGNPIGNHGVTISTGPSHPDQRAAAADFLDQLLAELVNLPIPPDRKAHLLAIAIKMRNLGPLGDQMAEIIEGDPNDPAQQAQNAMAKLQQQGQVMQELQQELQKLQLEKAGKVIENQGKAQLAQIDANLQVELARIKGGYQVAAAEVNTKAQSAVARMESDRDVYQTIHSDAHDAAMQKDQQAHEQQMAQQQAQVQAQSQAADQGHQQVMAEQQQQAESSAGTASSAGEQ